MRVLGTELGPTFIGYVTDRMVARLDGLSDEEYLWQPVRDCWTIRPAGDGVWRADLGPTGATATPIVPPPVTTIAWRLWHLGASPNPTFPRPLRPKTPAELIEEWFRLTLQSSSEAVPDAGTARRLVGEYWLGFADAIGEWSDGDFLTVMGPAAGAFAESTVLGLVVHIADELVHHSAEVGVLRDLYAHR
jgi:hypothetical protein